MKKLADWQKEESNSQAWKKIIHSPEAKLALEVARAHALPKPVKVETDNADTILTITAMTQATQTGWHQCLDFLEDILTSAPAKAKEQIQLKTLNPDA